MALPMRAPEKTGEQGGGSMTLDSGPKTRSGAEAGSQKRQSYRPLPAQFRHDGFNYRQIAREAAAAIYEQTWAGCSNPSVCYEVIRIRRREGFEIHGRFVEPSEVYPNSEAWGVDGFTFTDKDAAFTRFREINLMISPSSEGQKENPRGGKPAGFQSTKAIPRRKRGNR